MNQLETALARGRLYTLLQQLTLHGLTPDLLPLVQEIADLRVLIPEPYDSKEAAADYQDLFGFNVFPFESTFLEAEGMLGGAVTDAVLRSYQEIGYQHSPSSVGPDQLSEELGALAHLCLAEADALEDRRPEVVERMQTEQARFLCQHILRWVLPCVLAIRAQENPFYSELGSLATELLESHTADLTDAIGTALPLQFTLPPVSDILADEKTSLDDVANFLLTPAQSGLFLSRDVIQHWGRQHRLPRGFGGRKQTLGNLFRSAAQFDAVESLLDDLRKTIVQAIVDYEDYQQKLPILAQSIEPWRSRCKETLTFIEEIETQVGLFEGV